MAVQNNNFVCINLTKEYSEIESFETMLSKIKTGFHAFYTHEALISGIQESIGGSPESLEQTIRKAIGSIRKLPINDNTRSELLNNSPDYPLVLIEALNSSKPDSITTFFQSLREILNGDSYNPSLIRGLLSKHSAPSNFTDSPGFSLNQASSWDLCLEREKHSGLIPGAHDYHEYLLWDGGGCLSDKKMDDLDVWYGAGWISSRLRNHRNDSSISSDNWQVDKLSTWCISANYNLSSALDKLANFYQRKDKRPLNQEYYNNFVRSLCEFLPYHQSRRTIRRLIPSNSLGERGGPMRWRGLLDDQMYLRRRHLLMDGWLTLWSFEKNGESALYVQPGSLALLYWAAQTADMPYTDTPDNFLNNYDWSDPHWFGGNWIRRREQ